ncbi:DinB family protein [Pontibacillus litoralis]|uniref:DinB-like domain-containing protein n=1 Tax=Pontibacillus litoralis JSM 072002 TaxID=1385512 RepID=A0A0A5G3Q8_9BACI|nr:DinB family protein [Pontibacillus litoralis]KGX85773.1 hypothetical protein N784_08180 [Pontibacillus litoralis JSM 072002]
MKEQTIFKQFETGRQTILQLATEITEQTADIIAFGMPNSLRWQFGHIYVTGEQLLFRHTGERMLLTETYSTFFSPGSHPAYWEEEPPTVEELYFALEEQLHRVKEAFSGRLQERLTEPYYLGDHKLDTIGELLLFIIYHESEHIGTMKIMKNEINKQRAM